MMRKLIIAALVVVTLGTLASMASANYPDGGGYYVSQRYAENAVKQAAEARYEGNGVTARRSLCSPQGTPSSSHQVTFPGRYHRWTCWWDGRDDEERAVYGFFRITGHSNDTFGNLAVLGGLSWR